MTDEELLNFVEQKLFLEMLEGCEMDEYLGNPLDPAPWAVALRADTLNRLLDIARGKTL